MKTDITSKCFWDSRVNLNNRPSLSYRTVEVIKYIMEKEELPQGKVIELLISSENLYNETLKKLGKKYPDIKSQSNSSKI